MKNLLRKPMLPVFLISLMLFVISCDTDYFSLETDIYPEIESVKLESGTTISVQYKIGNLLILDTWSGLDASEKLYLIKKRTAKDPVHLKITSGDFSKTYFYYTIASVSVKTTPVKHSLLMEHVDSFPNVSWKYRNNKNVENKMVEEKPKKRKMDKL